MPAHNFEEITLIHRKEHSSLQLQPKLKPIGQELLLALHALKTLLRKTLTAGKSVSKSWKQCKTAWSPTLQPSTPKPIPGIQEGAFRFLARYLSRAAAALSSFVSNTSFGASSALAASFSSLV